MSQYLLNIAARNTGNDTHDLVPSAPVFKAADSGIIQGFAEENNIQDSAVQNQFVQQGIVPAPSIMPQKVQHADVFNKTESGVQVKSIETSYFSKHIERSSPEEENNPVKNKPTATINFKNEEASQKTIVENAEGKYNVYESVFGNKQTSIIVPGKKETNKQPGKQTTYNLIETGQVDEIISVKKKKIDPQFEDEGQKKNKLLPESSLIERITPNQPDQVNKRPIQNNKMNETATKLVIGKIIVEVLPPKLPVPPKIITRVVQSSSKDNYSKSNKLIFGLGQL